MRIKGILSIMFCVMVPITLGMILPLSLCMLYRRTHRQYNENRRVTEHPRCVGPVPVCRVLDCVSDHW